MSTELTLATATSEFKGNVPIYNDKILIKLDYSKFNLFVTVFGLLYVMFEAVCV